MSRIDIFLLDNLNNTKVEVNMIKPKTYQELLNQLRNGIKNLPKYYEIYIIGKNNEEIKINNEEKYKSIEDFLFIREINQNILDESLFARNYKRLSESQQDKLDEKFNCLLCSMIIKNENPYLCYQCQKIFHVKCLDNWDKKCKQENKKFFCPNCRNELPKENWNKKIDFEGNRKDNANLMNRINEYKLNNNMNNNINLIKDKKINELKYKEANQNELIKKYEAYIKKTIYLFKVILNKINILHNILNLKSNNELNNLNEYFYLNLENLYIDEISNVINEELDLFKTNLTNINIKKLKEENDNNKNIKKFQNFFDNTKIILGNNLSQIIHNYNKDQITLLKIAVDFYKENDLPQMNFNNEIQINNLINYLFNPNIICTNEPYRFSYITHDKRRKRIKFIFNSIIRNPFNPRDNPRYLVDIPIFFTKKELYSIDINYKCFYSTNIILIHNNKILKNDDSSFDEIANGDIIWVIENVLYPDDSYYLGLQKKYNGTELTSIGVIFDSGEVNVFTLSIEIVNKEFIRAIVERKGYALKDYKFLYNGKIVEPNDIRKIKEEPYFNGRILCSQNRLIAGSESILGKRVFGKGEIGCLEIGTLEPITKIFNQLARGGKIIIGKVELTSRSENYLSFYGINEDFNFIWKEE